MRRAGVVGFVAAAGLSNYSELLLLLVLHLHLMLTIVGTAVDVVKDRVPKPAEAVASVKDSAAVVLVPLTETRVLV